MEGVFLCFALAWLGEPGSRGRTNEEKKDREKNLLFFFFFFSTVETEKTGSPGGCAREGPGLDKAVPGGT